VSGAGRGSDSLEGAAGQSERGHRPPPPVVGRHAARLRWSEAGARAGTTWRSGAGAGRAGFRPWAEAEAGVFLFVFQFLFSKIPKQH